jgi:hypothetical protein
LARVVFSRSAESARSAICLVSVRVNGGVNVSGGVRVRVRSPVVR